MASPAQKLGTPLGMAPLLTAALALGALGTSKSATAAPVTPSSDKICDAWITKTAPVIGEFRNLPDLAQAIRAPYPPVVTAAVLDRGNVAVRCFDQIIHNNTGLTKEAGLAKLRLGFVDGQKTGMVRVPTPGELSPESAEGVMINSLAAQAGIIHLLETPPPADLSIVPPTMNAGKMPRPPKSIGFGPIEIVGVAIALPVGLLAWFGLIAPAYRRSGRNTYEGNLSRMDRLRLELASLNKTEVKTELIGRLGKRIDSLKKQREPHVNSLTVTASTLTKLHEERAKATNGKQKRILNQIARLTAQAQRSQAIADRIDRQITALEDQKDRLSFGADPKKVKGLHIGLITRAKLRWFSPEAGVRLRERLLHASMSTSGRLEQARTNLEARKTSLRSIQPGQVPPGLGLRAGDIAIWGAKGVVYGYVGWRFAHFLPLVF